MGGGLTVSDSSAVRLDFTADHAPSFLNLYFYVFSVLVSRPDLLLAVWRRVCGWRFSL